MAATNGFQTVAPDARYGTSYSSDSINAYEATKFTAPGSGTLTVTELGCWAYTSVDGGGNCRLAIFTHDAANNNPDTIVSNSDTGNLSLTTTPGFVKYTYTGTQPTVTGGTVYWILIHHDVNNNYLSRISGSGTSVYGVHRYEVGYPTEDVFDACTEYASDASFYAVYEVPATSQFARPAYYYAQQ